MSQQGKAERGSFQFHGLSVAPRLSCEARHRIQPSGWGAGEAKEREGKGRDACRGLRRDGFFGTSERGYTVLMNLRIHWSSNFLKYIMESLILAQNERWRRG